LISVNLDERKKQKEADDAFRKEMNAEKKLLAKADYAFKEFRLGPPTPPRIKAAKKDAEKDADADEEDAAEEENDTYVKADVHLRETLRVVSDAVGLAANKELWAANRPPLTGATGG
jgi:carboxyl-terminal processing protease